jgi:tetratricopeptide (TPR) repeat protein
MGLLLGSRNAARWFARHQRWVAVALLLAGIVGCFLPVLLAEPGKRLLWRAADALIREQCAEAERLARAVLVERPGCAPALLIAGEATAKSDRFQEALGYLLRVPEASPAEFVRAQYTAATRLMLMGRARDAEECLRRALAVDPRNPEANEKLALLLQIEGRTWESMPYVEAVVLSGRCGRDQLLMIGGVDAIMVDDSRIVEECLRNVPDDSLILLSKARMDLIENRPADAESLLRRILDQDPQQIEAQARLGELLVEQPDSAEFLQWQADLPKDADRHPLIWYLRGLWAGRNGQPRAAVRCFLEALRLHPNHSSSNVQLSQALFSLGLAEAAEPFAERGRKLSRVKALVYELKELTDLNMIRQAAEINQQLGCWWEAAGWCYAALSITPDAAWAHAMLTSPAFLAAATPEFTAASAQPALRLDLSAYPLPIWPEASASGSSMAEGDCMDGNVRLVDVAEEVGLVFRYYNGTTSTIGPEHILQTTGGGVAVIDYDLDGWPDLYFAQGGLWEERGDRSRFRNRLFRNLQGRRFADVTEEAGLDNGDFSQGAAVGDYNADGFPDLYLGNIGPNRLYKNNGDGTFSDVTKLAGVAGGNRWTTSCAIVDLNGDALPEIYAVNYAPLDEVLARHCGETRSVACSPTMFNGEQDRLFENKGDGTFRDVTEESGIVAPEGKGLGIVAAPFDGSGRIDIFVGNDTTANFFFVNQTAGPGRPLSFLEQGIVFGSAYNENGQGQACMGIAAGDPNGDGLLDLFVCNFYADSNTLYQQMPEHMFFDNTRQANLRQASFSMLGFGAQFLDGELDGRPDIIVSNGHVDRQIGTGIPDLMPPQYFRNLGDARFVELSSASLGPYFQKACLGRSVVVLDWNRDGKEDVCISHLDVPVALLTNRTPDTGHFLAVTLQGTTSNRDAIGAILHLTAGERTWMRQRIAGNGYLACNEPKIIFGLGPAERVDRLEVRWPSGIVQTFENLDVDQEIAIVEGEESPNRRLY